MKALVVSTNRLRAPFPVAPLGALFVAAAAEAAGHEVDLLDLTFGRSPVRQLAAALGSKPYEAVGLSIRNLDNCLYTRPESYVDGVRRLAQVVREHSDAPIIAGGSGFSVAPQGWLDRLDLPWGVVGEGESTLVEVLDSIAAGRSPEGVAGVVCRGSASSGRVGCRLPLAEIAPPAHERCDYGCYLARGGFVGVQSKRGCPHGCVFCTYPLLEGRTYRLRPPDAVGDEIERVYRDVAAASFFFTDGVFNTPREHALAICRDLARRRLPIRWMAYCNPIGFDGELAAAMVEAGCVGVEFGCDGCTDKSLAALGKPFAQRDVRTCLEAAAHAGLPCAVHLLFGGPGESVADIRESRAFLDGCPTPNAVFASLGIRIYAGTPIEATARREGVLADDADLFEPAYYVSEALGAEPMRALDEIARCRDEWSTPTDWTRLVMRLVQGILNRRGVRPQWLDVRNYGKYMRW